MRKTTYYLIAFLISSCLWQINAQTTHNLDWSMGISSADASLTIDAGDTVIWTFTDTAPHSVTSDTGSNETFDSGTLGAGSTYQYTFTEEGVNDYHCEVHPSMVGTITVNAAAVEDQVQIGDGTNESQHTPFEPYYWYSYTQSIYLSSEINASGNITSLQWYYSGTSALEDNQDLTIYLGETTKSSFSSSQDWEDVANLTQVYNGGITVTAGTPGWVTITFDTPFEYTGEGNLMVAVDENGGIIRSDILMVLFLPEVIKNPGDTIVYDVKCSQALEDMILKYGGKPVMWKTGHSLIKDKMKELDVNFAGEMSGHIFFADDFFGFDDAIYVSLRLAQLLSRTNRTLSELTSEIPVYHSTPEMRLECSDDEEKFKISKKADEYFTANYNCSTVDGVRIKFDDGWGLVRASNTQPVIVCRFEAKTLKRMEEIQNEILDKLAEFGEIALEHC